MAIALWASHVLKQLAKVYACVETYTYHFTINNTP